MLIKKIPVAQINPAPYNPRMQLAPGDPDYEKLLRSIDEFGLVEPLVWNKRTGNLVGGHQRFSVLLARGEREVTVSIVDLPLEREKALNIALNKIQGAWDERKLAELLDELTALPEFDIELTGFSTPEVDELVAEILHAHPDEPEEFDVDAHLDRSRPAVTRKGEVVELGRHRLLCGDSSNERDVAKLLADQRPHLLFTDPPYNVDYYGGNRPTPEKARPKPSRQWQRIYSDNLSQEDYLAWLSKVLHHACDVLNPGAAFYIWNGHRQFGPMHAALEKMGLHVACVLTWAKETFAIGYGDYNQQTEFCLYGWRPRPRPRKVGSKRDDKSNSVGDAESPHHNDNSTAHAWHGPTNESTLWLVKRDPTKSYQHPTQKPLELAERAIRNSTRPGQLVLDTFLGSGTTLIAAERLGRRCVGLEIDSHYCDVIARRYLACVGTRNAPPELVKRFSERSASQPSQRKVKPVKKKVSGAK